MKRIKDIAPVEPKEARRTPKEIEAEKDAKIAELEDKHRRKIIDFEEFLRQRSMVISHAEGEMAKITKKCNKPYDTRDGVKNRLF